MAKSSVKAKNIDTSSAKASDVKYFRKHWIILKNNFKLDDVTIKLILTDIGFILTLMLSYVLVYMLWARSVFSLSSLLDTISAQIPDSALGVETINLWHTFITNVILFAIVVIILYAVLISIYSAVSHKIITKNKFSAGLFLNFIYVYMILTLVYLLLLISIFYLSNNIMLIAWGILIFTLLYVYALLIFYLVTKEGKLSIILVHGFKSMILLHNTLPPIILSILIWIIFTIVVHFIFGKLLIVTISLVLFSILYLATWVKRYLYHIIHS